MNTSNIKKYAPVARKQFRDAVMQKLTTLGIEADKKGNLQIAQATDLGDQVRYGQFSLDKALASRRERLVKRAEKQGYDVLVEHIAYTWFNRFCAIRYMELHGYLDHGFRMLSHPTLEGGFEVLDHVPEVADALGLDKARLVEMKLAGDRDEELYRELLLAQCHALHGAMPFLFEAVNDDIELVLPDNLTRTDSILRGLVDIIPEEDWEQVEVIGWLYQFYISEKKDDVIGKVVKSEDIPAATQLFTPNWIVQYLVQNSVGRQWLQTYPDSSLKGKMPYYIEPAEQTPEVRAQLAAITPSSIEPESIKVLDPACGSGHILTEAYNVLKAIYEERGYRTRDIPQLILENNIFGLDIDDRAAQLSGFAMLMLARQDDRRILGRGVRLNIVSLQESKLDIAELWTKLNFHQQVQRGSMGDMFAEGTALANTDSAEYKLLIRTLALFTSAKTLGSLIQVPHEDEAALKAFLDGLYRLAVEGDNQQKEAAVELIPYIQQAWILAQHYDATLANPPYMGTNSMNNMLKSFVQDKFPASKADLYSLFIERSLRFLKLNGFFAQINMQSWMFISSYKALRNKILDNNTILSMLHLGPKAFSQITGEVVQTTAWICQNILIKMYHPTFFRLVDGDEETKKLDFLNGVNKFKDLKQIDLDLTPSRAIVYWEDSAFLKHFRQNSSLSDFLFSDGVFKSSDNERYLRYFWEVDYKKVDGRVYRLISKGGESIPYYGNNENIAKWDNESRLFYKSNNVARLPPEYVWDLDGVTWSKVTSGKPTFRFLSENQIAESVGPGLYAKQGTNIKEIILFLNSSIAARFLNVINPTLGLQAGDVLSVPYVNIKTEALADRLIKIHKDFWDEKEISPNFKSKYSMLRGGELNLKYFFSDLSECNERLLEEVHNLTSLAEQIYLKSFEVIVSSDLSSRDINISSLEKKKNLELKNDTLIKNLVSYSIGCQMGRYSLDREGLVYAHEGNKGFAELIAEGAYKTFPADEDGILPLMDSNWFDDDVTARVKEFVRTVWGEEHLQENLDFIAESLCLYAIKPKKGESSLDTIRRYLSTQFWKDHMKMYKKRPIYWLFSSGKEKAFECLVYLHRYNEGTLSRMRTEYVVPLLARYQGNIDLVNDQLKNSESGAATTRLKKELDGLTKKFNELRNFDDRLRHYADRRITIDLDDGVKVNYGKFGDLLADVKAITGSAPEEI